MDFAGLFGGLQLCAAPRSSLLERVEAGDRPVPAPALPHRSPEGGALPAGRSLAADHKQTFNGFSSLSPPEENGSRRRRSGQPNGVYKVSQRRENGVPGVQSQVAQGRDKEGRGWEEEGEVWRDPEEDSKRTRSVEFDGSVGMERRKREKEQRERHQEKSAVREQERGSHGASPRTGNAADSPRRAAVHPGSSPRTSASPRSAGRTPSPKRASSGSAADDMNPPSLSLSVTSETGTLSLSSPTHSSRVSASSVCIPPHKTQPQPCSTPETLTSRTQSVWAHHLFDSSFPLLFGASLPRSKVDKFVRQTILDHEP